MVYKEPGKDECCGSCELPRDWLRPIFPEPVDPIPPVEPRPLPILDMVNPFAEDPTIDILPPPIDLPILDMNNPFAKPDFVGRNCTIDGQVGACSNASFITCL